MRHSLAAVAGPVRGLRRVEQHRRGSAGNRVFGAARPPCWRTGDHADRAGQQGRAAAAHQYRHCRIRGGIGDADRRRSGYRQIDIAVAGSGTGRGARTVGRLYQWRGSDRSGAVAGTAAGTGQCAGDAGERHVGAGYFDHAGGGGAARSAHHRFNPDDA